MAMTRFTRFWAVAGVGCALGLAAWGGSAAVGRTPAVPPPPPPVPIPDDLDQLAFRMGEGLRALDAAVANDLGATPRGRRLRDETSEMAQAVNEFQSGLRNQADRFQARRAY